jgi:hypothetical protein
MGQRKDCLVYDPMIRSSSDGQQEDCCHRAKHLPLHLYILLQWPRIEGLNASSRYVSDRVQV